MKKELTLNQIVELIGHRILCAIQDVEEVIRRPKYEKCAHLIVARAERILRRHLNKLRAKIDLPVSIDLGAKGFSLSFLEGLTDEQQCQIISRLSLWHKQNGLFTLVCEPLFDNYRLIAESSLQKIKDISIKVSSKVTANSIKVSASTKKSLRKKSSFGFAAVRSTKRPLFHPEGNSLKELVTRAEAHPNKRIVGDAIVFFDRVKNCLYYSKGAYIKVVVNYESKVISGYYYANENRFEVEGVVTALQNRVYFDYSKSYFESGPLNWPCP